ncbi:MAG: Gfo/Idh/MocA family oxidoreductase [Flavobacteriales bacterium]|nr:Gfo/Idh/MocA family oxidoreductase [Flavobacteriales bacterium]
MQNKQLRIGVLGAGHLGKIHIKILKQSPSYELIGFYDPNPAVSAKTQAELEVKAYQDMDMLLDDVDVVDIVTPTLSHFDCAIKGLRKFKHLFIEKPITNTLDEAKQLRKLAEEAGTKIQVGHVERFNPAYQAVAERLDRPMFIETHRLAQFNPRGTDVPVVLDLMIHDIDIILHVTRSNVRSVHASGVNVISETPDIANARIEFENGCVANLTASRISLKNMRKSRFFQRDAYISVDFLEKVSEVVSMAEIEGEPDPFAITMDPGNGKPLREVTFDRPEVEPNNAIGDELEALAQAIHTDTEPPVTAEDGYMALSIAHRIMEQIERRSMK